jgi:two-component system, NtrC family, nitrogen regulation response regulator GlnG
MPSAENSGTILIVDDDRAIRALVETFLERGGYTTLSADSGEVALQVMEHHHSDIVLLLTDVTMPGIDGLELARRVHRSNPKLPVLVMSAHSDRPGELNEFPFLPKPFIAADLLSRVREMLAHAC